METDRDDEINPEIWLQVLLAMTGDKNRKEELIRRISEKTNQPLEQVELIVSATINFMANKARSN